MTFMYFAEILFGYAFISVIETGFIVIFSLIMMNEKLTVYDCVLPMVPLSLLSYLILDYGDSGFLFRLMVVGIIWIWLSIKYRYDSKKMLKLAEHIVVATIIMIFVELIAFIPYLFIFGTKLNELTKNVYITVLLSMPTRVFEYIILYIIYLRKVGLNSEKVIKEN